MVPMAVAATDVQLDARTVAVVVVMMVPVAMAMMVVAVPVVTMIPPTITIAVMNLLRRRGVGCDISAGERRCCGSWRCYEPKRQHSRGEGDRLEHAMVLLVRFPFEVIT